MMRLLAALLIAAPLAAYAQYEPVGAPVGEGTSRRSPWYIGFGLGTGNGSMTDTTGDYTFKEWNSFWQGVDVSPTNVTFNFKVGATLTPRLLLGFDVTAIRSSATDQDWTTAVQVNNYDAVVTWFPLGEGPFLRGGAGLSAVVFSLDTPVSSASDSYEGFNVLAGAGYALWLGQAFNLTFNVDYSIQSYGDGTPEWDGSKFWNLWVGFDWY